MRIVTLFAALSIVGGLVACGGSEDNATTGDDAEVNARREAFTQSCTLKELHDDNVFEESLSEEEYPDVSVERDGKTGEITVSIGSSLYSSKDDDLTVKLVKKSATESETSIVMKAGVSYFVRLTATGGKITTAEGRKAETEVADLKCTAPTWGTAANTGSSSGGGSTQTCPSSGTINCMPPTTNASCAPERRRWIQQSCPDVHYLD